MHNFRGKILDTVRTHAKAHVDKHLMNVEILVGSHAGVAEHPDMIETVEKELMEAAKYQDILDMLNKFGT